MRVAVIGAGPAGLSCADKLKNLDKNIQIYIYEKSKYIGGISKTINYKNTEFYEPTILRLTRYFYYTENY